MKEYKLNWALQTNLDTDDIKEKIIYQLIEETANDSNSSKFREDVTKWIVGLETSEKKLGYDDDFHPIEVKPKNFTGRAKLDGGGQFNDFTWKRHEKYSRDEVTMLISGFYYGRIIFVIEFKYSDIKEKIEKHLNRLLPNGDEPNRYVRSANFSYNNWKESNFVVKYKSPNIAEYKNAIVGKLYKLLTK